MLNVRLSRQLGISGCFVAYGSTPFLQFKYDQLRQAVIRYPTVFPQSLKRQVFCHLMQQSHPYVSYKANPTGAMVCIVFSLRSGSESFAPRQIPLQSVFS